MANRKAVEMVNVAKDDQAMVDLIIKRAAPDVRETRMKTSKARPVRDEQKLRTVARKHISYEIKMLMFSADRLNGWHSSPIQPPSGNAENMALETFLLHFRNLRAFLCPSLQMTHKEDILASDFLGSLQSADVGDSTNLRPDVARLDEMLAHLSYLREGHIGAGADEWPVAEMTIVLLTELKTFLGQVPAFQGEFPSVADIEGAINRATWKLQGPGEEVPEGK